MVGLIGVGTMGSQIARAFAERGDRLTLWDINQEALAPWVSDHGISDSARSLAEMCDVVLMSLPLPSDVVDVVVGDRGLLSIPRRPRCIVDLSTVDPDTSRQMGAAAKGVGVSYLDAPVLGRPANCGRWTLPIGGDPSHLLAVEAILGVVATRIVNVGPVGSGNIVKLLNNLMFGAINAITVECMAVAMRLGLPPEVFYQTIVESGAATVSNLFRELGPKILMEDWSPVFSLSLLEKDNRLGIAMCTETHVELIVARAVDELNRRGLAAGLGDLDTSSLIQLMGAK